MLIAWFVPLLLLKAPYFAGGLCSIAIGPHRSSGYMLGPSRTNYKVFFQGHWNIMPENCLTSVQMIGTVSEKVCGFNSHVRRLQSCSFHGDPPTHLFRKGQRMRSYFCVCVSIILQGSHWRKWKWSLHMTERILLQFFEFSLVSLFQGFYRQVKKIQEYCMKLYSQFCITICYIIYVLC